MDPVDRFSAQSVLCWVVVEVDAIISICTDHVNVAYFPSCPEDVN